ncbi:hypothetical protein HXX76_008965 [Chlamydomonas incerta]|uniref:SGNH hydrolase-type esterase domain-containing protein n=1 Tax=Chlamydomonas incerta TaxID=51695 RepID=A0A835VYI3_CHLIN|nr:hypothetical protein HXX76_008965 [Chlamydomonas incerta]|eukprot:KAG2432625.1 hypothetical protein HXX76_008965 [Chlamydomonas incerta]
MPSGTAPLLAALLAVCLAGALHDAAAQALDALRRSGAASSSASGHSFASHTAVNSLATAAANAAASAGAGADPDASGGASRALPDDVADALVDAGVARWRRARRRLRQQQQQHAGRGEGGQGQGQQQLAWKQWQQQEQHQQEDDGGGDGGGLGTSAAAGATGTAGPGAGSEAGAGAAGAAGGGSSTAADGGSSSTAAAVMTGLHRLLAAAKHHRAKSPESHVLKLRQLQRAMYLGDLERIRSFVWRMAAGERLTVALLGGSVTMGMGAVLAEPSYAQWLQMWFAEVAPARPDSGLPPEGPSAGLDSGRAGAWLGVVGPGWNASTVRVINAACPATSSGYMNLCLKEYLLDAAPPDLVLLEYAINDPPFPQPAFENEPRKSLELLLRKLLLLPGRPAVALLNGYRWQGQFTLPGPTKREALGVYYSNAEPEYFEFATYYGLQLLSLKAAVYHQMVAGVRSFRTDLTRAETRANGTSDKMAFFYEDPIHPSGLTGHRAMAELVEGMLVKVGRGLVMRPWRQNEEAARQAPLPRHLIPGNEDSFNDVCILGDRLRESAADQKGFDWVNEGRDPRAPKWGFTATQPGSNITFVLNTASPASDPAAPGASAGTAAVAATANANATAAVAAAAAAALKPRFVILILAYLRSYENMGMADIHCAGGCVCGARALALYDKYGGENGTGAAMAPAAAAAYAAAVAAAAAEAKTQAEPAARLDGLWEPRASQLQLGCVQALLLAAAPAAAHAPGATATPGAGSCRVMVRVAQETRSGGHKVKLGGLIVSESSPALASGMCRDNAEATQRAAGYIE